MRLGDNKRKSPVEGKKVGIISKIIGEEWIFFIFYLSTWFLRNWVILKGKKKHRWKVSFTDSLHCYTYGERTSARGPSVLHRVIKESFRNPRETDGEIPLWIMFGTEGERRRSVRKRGWKDHKKWATRRCGNSTRKTSLIPELRG